MKNQFQIRFLVLTSWLLFTYLLFKDESNKFLLQEPNKNFLLDLLIQFDLPSNPYIKNFPLIDRQNFQTLPSLYQTSAFLANGSKTTSLNMKLFFLCKLKIKNNCFHTYISEVLDQMVNFAPVYFIEQPKKETLLEKHHKNFLGYLTSIGIRSIVVETINPKKNQTYRLTKPNNEPWEFQRTFEVAFYMRENLLNFLAKKTQDFWEYMIWVDAHQSFKNLYWFEEAIYKMEHHPIVQMFSKVYYLDWMNRTTPNSINSIMYNRSFSTEIISNIIFAGNAWGMKKEVYNGMGYLLDTCIVAGCDYSLALSLLDDPDKEWPSAFKKVPNYGKQLWPWIEKTRKYFNKKRAFIYGDLIHIDHEHLFDYFGYLTMIENSTYNAETDMYRDEEFILHVKNPKIKDIFSTVRPLN